MTAARTSTPHHIIERNRQNALRSTGPTTEAGKAVSRRNALKHGLCANPACGVAEDPGVFNQLYDVLIARFEPRCPIEAGLVHRIAVCLWRLQRSVRIETALDDIAAGEISPAHERVQAWVHRITNNFWLLEDVEITDRKVLDDLVSSGMLKRGQRWYRPERGFLRYADEFREKEIMKDGAAIMAMCCLIQDLVRRLEACRPPFSALEAQLLAWLMGESADRLVDGEPHTDEGLLYYPDERSWASGIDSLIGQARIRSQGETLPEALIGAVDARIACLRSQARQARTPYRLEHERSVESAALLPNTETLDRLLRYEAHAERGLRRSLEMLAKLRGTTMNSVTDSIPMLWL